MVTRDSTRKISHPHRTPPPTPRSTWSRIHRPLLCAAMLLGAGCTQYHHTHPRRSATELYLMSTAVDQAVEALDVRALQGRTVYIDTTLTPDPDHLYLIGSVRAKFLAHGVLITNWRDRADIIAELRTAGVSIDRSEFLIGIPSFPVGQAISAAGLPASTIGTPELALVKEDKRWGAASVAFVAYWRQKGKELGRSGPHLGRSYREDWSFFGLSGTASNVPVTQPPKKVDAETKTPQANGTGKPQAAHETANKKP
ncbi:MAG: DUF6655 family protein [Phycisphaeraceae bacterium]|nr:DUF6655 family protein [Phycisphaeraceae bacterium]